jgi:hypothetical protein
VSLIIEWGVILAKVSKIPRVSDSVFLPLDTNSGLRKVQDRRRGLGLPIPPSERSVWLSSPVSTAQAVASVAAPRRPAWA